MIDGRNDKGQFIKGRIETKEQMLRRIEAAKKAWVKRSDYIDDIKIPRLHNIWRGIRFTKKGKKIGNSLEWNDYRTFYNDVIGTYKEGLLFRRIDVSENYNKDNFIWVDNETAVIMRKNLIMIEYDGERLTPNQLGVKYGLNPHGITQRYSQCKHYTTEEVIFGRKKQVRKKLTDARNLGGQEVRDKASKMISSYRITDKKRGFVCNLTIDWLIQNIIFKKCTYCGDHEYVGCDRIDNHKGHTIENVLPCCQSCNAMRGDRFTVDEMKRIGRIVKTIKKDRVK